MGRYIKAGDVIDRACFKYSQLTVKRMVCR